ncbi:serine hydrolase domain-containing protein [Aquirufa sp. ROCK-SH2]
MKIILTKITLLLAVFFFVNTTFAQKFDTLDQFLKNEIQSKKLMGVHGLVYHKDKVVYNKFYGNRDVDKNVKMSGNEIYYLQSMSKPIVTVALMTLYEQGKFQLDDPVENYLPEFKNLQVVKDVNVGMSSELIPAQQKITIRQLLSHTSGMSHGITQVKMDRDIWNTILYDQSLTTIEKRVKALAKIPLSYQPGSKWNYSFGPDVASRLIEVLSGETTDSFLKKTIFQPLGMKDIGYNLNEEQQKRAMIVYDFADGKNLTRSKMQPQSAGVTVFAGVNALWGTMDDYLKFAKMLYNNGELNGKRILKKETLELMRQDVTHDITRKPDQNSRIYKIATGISMDEDGSTNLEPGYGFGIGFGMLKDPMLANRTNVSVGEYFWSGANSTHFFVNPKDDVIGIFMTQIGALTTPNPYQFYFSDEFRTGVYEGIKKPTKKVVSLESVGEKEVKELGFKPSILNDYENFVIQSIQNKDIAGAVTLIARKGKIVHFEAKGESQMETHIPMKKDAIFRLASMTKPIATLALLLLMEDGKCKPNDPVSKYLPEFASQQVLISKDSVDGHWIYKTKEATKPMLIKHVLTHTTGQPSAYGGNMPEIYNAITKDVYFSDLEHYVKKLSKLPLTHEPGDGWIYGPGLLVAGRIVEVITGQPFQDFVQKRILDPLGMVDTHFYLEPKDAPRFTSYYQPDGKGGLALIDPGSEKSIRISGQKTYYSGSGGLHSTALDYFKFSQMVLQNGELNGVRIAKPSTIAMMKTDYVPLNLEAAITPTDNLKNNGFTFGYAIKRKEIGNDPRPAGTLYWSGATGPIFFIDQKHEMIAMVLLQRPSTNPPKLRTEFKNWIMKSLEE